MEDTKNYTPEQTEVLETVYGYSDKAHYTEEDIALARQMFDTPEKFALLRKILQVLTPAERGLTIKDAQSLVNANANDLNAYAIETAVNFLADEKVRQTLYSFYRLLRGTIVAEKKAEFDEKNRQDFKEKQNTEQFAAEQEAEKKKLGDNL